MWFEDIREGQVGLWKVISPPRQNQNRQKKKLILRKGYHLHIKKQN